MSHLHKVKDKESLSVERIHPPSDEYKFALVKSILSQKDPSLKIYTIEMMQRLDLIDVKVQTEFAQIVKDEGLKRRPSMPLLGALIASINTPELLTDIQGMNINRMALELVDQKIQSLSKLHRK